MTHYHTKMQHIRHTLYANQDQLDTVIGVRNYIDNHYDTDLNLELLAQLRLVSKFHLLRLFKKYYGQTPKQYLTDIRIKKSREHLKSGMSVTETCFAVGFESVGSFSVLFKDKTGMGPRDFQKRATFKK